MENHGNSSFQWLREEEYNRIWMLLKMFMESTTPLSILVIAFGEAGTGKTTLAKRIVLNATSVWKDLRIVYLDPYVDNRQCFSAMLQKVFNLAGYSTPEILRSMEESGDRFLIIIDDAETILSEKNVRDILKISEGFPHGRFFVILFFSSATIPVNALRFSQSIYFIHLNPYSPSEIRMILSIYLNKAGKLSINEDALNAIIKASKGNASLALEMLKLTIHSSASRSIDENHILKVLKKIGSNPFFCKTIRIDDPHVKAIFKVASHYPQGIRLKKLFEEYCSLCKENGIRPLGYTQFWKKIRILEKKTLLDFRVINLRKGRMGIVRIKCTIGKTSL